MRHVARRIRWYVREFTGESAYERYVAHARAHAGAGGQAGEIMTRRAFERSRTDAREADPREGFRCC
ncbi:YbdD/YjiX family protein [Streptomyces sp. NPDC059096]|uniref:YbdD/YjiX family protein n=1 Tax=Streptomyces sp. NPDC059096 TaxID=3346727 RepID=UPI0036C457C0